jgi:peptidyl-prolyl cis-trans isomerase SurA
MNAIFNVADSLKMFEGKWNADTASNLLDTVFYIGDRSYSQYDIAKYLAGKRLLKRINLDRQILDRTRSFINEEIIAYEESKLPEKYPDYKHLLEEYHDGILLFNLTEDKVWQKAIEDSAGLDNYYNSLPVKHRWEKRIAVTKYVYSDSALTDPLIKAAKTRAKKDLNETELSSKICPQDTIVCVHFTEIKYERGDNAIADSITWEKGSVLQTRDGQKNILYFVDAVLPEQDKTLADARGIYTADYQTYLENQWIEELRGKYEINVNQEVLSAIKKDQGQ